MKRFLLSVSLVSAASLILFTGCGKKISSTVAEPTTEAPVTETETKPLIIDPQGNILSEKPTERQRDIEESTDFEYEIIDGKAVITKYTGKDKDITVPDQLEGVPVTEIGYYAFEAHYDITSVTLPETVTLIGECAFMDCSSMTSINIPEALTGIDRGAFVACTSLTELNIPASVNYIQEEAFTACESLTALHINNPDLEYSAWGLEDLPDLVVYAPAGSAVQQWASDKGLNVVS